LKGIFAGMGTSFVRGNGLPGTAILSGRLRLD